MKVIRIVVILSMSVLLTGCIDIFQYVGKSGNTIDVYYKIVMDKSLIGMAASFGGEQVELNDEYFEEEFGFDAQSLTEDIPEGVEVNVDMVNTESQFGFKIRYSLSERSAPFRNATIDDFPGIPLKSGNTYLMLFENDNADELEEETDAMTESILAGMTYRLMIEKNYIPSIRSVSFTNDERDAEIPFEEFGETYLIEIPMLYWLTSSSGVLVIE